MNYLDSYQKSPVRREVLVFLVNQPIERLAGKITARKENVYWSYRIGLASPSDLVIIASLGGNRQAPMKRTTFS